MAVEDSTGLTLERLKQLIHYEPETGLFTRVSSRIPSALGPVKCKPAATGHQRIRIDGSLYLIHRLAWLYMHGKWPPEFVDHINGDPTDNRFLNLRAATNAENLRNSKTRSHSSSGIRNVSLVRRTNNRFVWQAIVRFNGLAYKKLFPATEDGKRAATEWATATRLEKHGEFAWRPSST